MKGLVRKHQAVKVNNVTKTLSDLSCKTEVLCGICN